MFESSFVTLFSFIVPRRSEGLAEWEGEGRGSGGGRGNLKERLVEIKKEVERKRGMGEEQNR